MATDWGAFDKYIKATGPDQQIVLKVIVFDEANYLYAKEAASRYPALSVYLQPGNHTPPPADDDYFIADHEGMMEQMYWLVDKVTANTWFDARVLPQLHVLLLSLIHI